MPSLVGIIALFLAATGSSSTLAADTNIMQSFSSGTKPVALLELFSTQSCHSCPPAQSFVSSLKSHPDLFKTFVPVVFHVHYWDYLGWKDHYSEKKFTHRQRRYVRALKLKSMHTPMTVFKGAYMPPKQRRLEWVKQKAVTNAKAEQNGKLQVVRKTKERFQITYTPAANKKQLQNPVFYAALIGNDIATRVRSGENAGKKLEQDFIVLEFVRVDATIDQKSASATANIRLETEKRNSGNNGIVVWVSDGENVRPLQAVGGLFHKTEK